MSHYVLDACGTLSPSQVRSLRDFQRSYILLFKVEGEREEGRKGTKEGEGKSSGPREPRRPRRSLFDRLDLLCFAGQGQSSLEVVGTAAIMELGRSRARPKMKPKILPLDAKPKKNPKYDKIGPQVDTGYNARKQLER